jgi:hypothetical protein
MPPLSYDLRRPRDRHAPFRAAEKVVASGEPATPLICWADAGLAASATTQTTTAEQVLDATLIDSTTPLDLIRRQASPVQSYDVDFNAPPSARSTYTADRDALILHFGTMPNSREGGRPSRQLTHWRPSVNQLSIPTERRKTTQILVVRGVRYLLAGTRHHYVHQDEEAVEEVEAKCAAR